jgi:predicted outer membrane protein
VDNTRAHNFQSLSMYSLKCSLLFALVWVCAQAAAQGQEVPTGVQLTPAFQVPPIASANFKAKYPGTTESWKPYGELYAASFRQLENNLEKTVIFDKNGMYRGQYVQVKKPDYPKAIDYFFESYYPDEKYTVWQMHDSSGIKYYYAPVSDTVWFTRDGKYTWPHKHDASLSESDIEILTGVAADQILDVTLAQLAAVNAHSPEVKNMASRRDSNNFELHRQLKNISALKHVHLPTELNAKQQKTLAELNKLQGDQFDKAYTRYLIKADKKATSRLKRSSRYADDPVMKEWMLVSKKLSDENAILAKQAYCSVK